MIELQNVSLAYYAADTPVLTNISRIFDRNEFTFIIGINGSGKSTLLRAMAGLMPFAGNIKLCGDNLRSLPGNARARRICYLPQQRPVPALEAGMLIAHGRYPHLGFSKTLSSKDKEQVARAASITGVTSLLERELSTLSGGERQRVYIAMMVAQDAGFMLLDEPTTHLDIEHQLEVMELLKRLHQSGKAIIAAAHDLPQAFTYASRVLLISQGGIAADGKPDALCESPAIHSALGVTIKKAAGRDELYAYRMTKGASNGHKEGC